MNRDEFEFGFDPEEEQEARRPKAGNTGHTFVPAFRQAETEETSQTKHRFPQRAGRGFLYGSGQ